MELWTRTVLSNFRILLAIQILVGILNTPSAYAFKLGVTECELQLSQQISVLPEDILVIQETADKENLEIIAMAPNPASFKYRSLPGYVAKPAELKKCKTAVTGPAQGLVQCPEHAFKNHSEWLHNKIFLKSLGYEVLGPEQSYLVRRIADGKYFFSDYDLFSVRNHHSHQPAYSENFRTQINTRLGRRLVRHGPLSDYEHREDVLIKLPLFVITPGKPKIVIETREQMEREFKARGLPFW